MNSLLPLGSSMTSPSMTRAAPFRNLYPFKSIPLVEKSYSETSREAKSEESPLLDMRPALRQC